MRLIQVVLVPSLILFGVLYFRRYRTLLLDRLFVIGLCALGAVFVMRPNLTMAVAHWFGVGRGADLIFYVGLVGLTFFNLILWSRQRDFDKRLTDLARQIALSNPGEPDVSPPPKNSDCV
jgi:hypothetical protein